MLVQLPRGSSDQPGSDNADAKNAFEAALRRDLASAPVVSYDAMLGGWPKRAADLSLALVSAPLWLPLLLGAAAVSKLRHRAPVFLTEERVGYGGRAFKCFALRVSPPSAKIEHLFGPENAPEAAPDLSAMQDKAEGRRAKWRRAFERLPQMFNVIAGDMAIVGPMPLTQEELEPLKSAKRHYLSARPGIVGVRAIAEADEEDASQYKMYAMSWSLLTDALLLWDSLHSVRDRGELWKPSFKLPKAGPQRVVVVRRRSAS